MTEIIINGHHEMYKLHNKHKGQRCFIMGSGPSLNKTPLRLLDKELVIGCNTLYKLQFPFTYFCVSDIHVWKNHAFDILNQPVTLILSDGARAHFISHQTTYERYMHPKLVLYHIPTIGDVKYIRLSDECIPLKLDLSEGVIHGGTVIVDICLQLAFHMGCNPIYLVGVDFNYSGKHHWDGTRADMVDGCAKGQYDECKYAFEVCDFTFHKYGREIIDCTPDGKLPMFKKMKLEDVICPSL